MSDVTAHRDEIEKLLGTGPAQPPPPHIIASDPEIEDPVAFAMEKHLEAFLVVNWNQTLLSRDFSIYEEDGEPVGQQFATDVGLIDVLAISKDRKRLLVVELKRGRASDVVVGQVLRYMGFVKEADRGERSDRRRRDYRARGRPAVAMGAHGGSIDCVLSVSDQLQVGEGLTLYKTCPP